MSPHSHSVAAFRSDALVTTEPLRTNKALPSTDGWGTERYARAPSGSDRGADDRATRGQ